MTPYTEPCPHCGQPMDREPTLVERVREVVNDGISETYNIMREEAYWPGTISLTQRVMAAFEKGGIGFVDLTAESDEHTKSFDRGYVAGLEAARTLCTHIGSPAAALITTTISEYKGKNK